MPPDGLQPQTTLVPGPGRIRGIIAASAAVVVMGCSLYVGVVDSLHENKVVFHDAPPDALPPGHVAQIEMFRKLVPKGSVVIYFMPQPETWRFGLWKRSLFPDYIILPVAGSKVLDSPPVVAFRKRHHVQYAILVNTSLPEAAGVVPLPEYPPRTTTALARLGD
jgi:hypothetical protein